jgi:hypothetical protein
MDITAVRAIIYHKQATSARTLFLSLDNTVCLFDGLPNLSSLLELEDDKIAKIAIHPAAIITKIEQKLGLDNGCLKLDSEFQAQVDTPKEKLTIFLLRATCIDPPREQVAQHGGRFIALTEARNYPTTELELLRRAYSSIMEG